MFAVLIGLGVGAFSILVGLGVGRLLDFKEPQCPQKRSASERSLRHKCEK